MQVKTDVHLRRRFFRKVPSIFSRDAGVKSHSDGPGLDPARARSSPKGALQDGNTPDVSPRLAFGMCCHAVYVVVRVKKVVVRKGVSAFGKVSGIRSCQIYTRPVQPGW